MFLLLQNNDVERVSSITGYEEMRFAFQMTNTLPHQKQHVTLIRNITSRRGDFRARARGPDHYGNKDATDSNDIQASCVN